MSSSQRYVGWLHRGNLQGVWGALMGAVFVPFGAFGSGMRPPFPFIFLFPLGALAGFLVGRTIGALLLGGSGAAAQHVYMPDAAGTYTHTHSQIDAMEARGDYRGAVAAWEAVAVEQPGEPWPLIRAGEIYLRTLNEPSMALDRFRHARELPGISAERERYVSQKIIDLYLGPLADEGRALVELRRLMDRHPGTREAAGARAAIASLKGLRGEGNAGRH
jgi:hypothetical protein